MSVQHYPLQFNSNLKVVYCGWTKDCIHLQNVLNIWGKANTGRNTMNQKMIFNAFIQVLDSWGFLKQWRGKLTHETDGGFMPPIHCSVVCYHLKSPDSVSSTVIPKSLAILKQLVTVMKIKDILWNDEMTVIRMEKFRRYEFIWLGIKDSLFSSFLYKHLYVR